MLPTCVSCPEPGSAAGGRGATLSPPALVAQGIEHRPPEPCAQVRILSRALLDMGRELGKRPGHGQSPFSPSLTAIASDSPLFAGAPRGERLARCAIQSVAGQAAPKVDQAALRCAGRAPREVEQQLDFAVSDRAAAPMSGRSGTDVACHPLPANRVVAPVRHLRRASERCDCSIAERVNPPAVHTARPAN
jgi:hypothetical protein